MGKEVRFRYRGRRSEIAGRRTRNDGRRTPGAGEAGREEEGCSLGMINTTRTPSSYESSEDGSRSTRNWTFSICKSDEKLVTLAKGRRETYKMISCLLMLSIGILVLHVSIEALSVGFLSILVGFARILFRKIHVLGISRQMIKFDYVWNSYFYESAYVRTRIRNFSILLNALSGLFQYIWQRPLVPLALYKRSNKLHSINWISFEISLSWFQSNFNIVKIPFYQYHVWCQFCLMPNGVFVSKLKIDFFLIAQI